MNDQKSPAKGADSAEKTEIEPSNEVSNMSSGIRLEIHQIFIVL